MAGHVCDNCGSVVGADDQFCPSCGAWIDPTTVSYDAPADDYESFELGDRPPADLPSQPVRLPQQEIQCPSCGSPNPATNRHCEECGARLSQGALPVAPRPAVQTSAGVRAAMAISGILLGVVVIALLFTLTGDDETDNGATDTTTSTTTTTVITPEELPILDATCSVEGLANLQCTNLIDGTTEREYQINWEELEADEQVTIELKFAEAMVITQIIWENLPADSDRFFQNYRARDILVSDGSTAAPLSLDAAREPRRQDHQPLRQSSDSRADHRGHIGVGPRAQEQHRVQRTRRRRNHRGRVPGGANDHDDRTSRDFDHRRLISPR